MPLLKWCWKAEPSADLGKVTPLSPTPSTWDQLGLAVAFESSALSLVQDLLSPVFHFTVCSLWPRVNASVQLFVPRHLANWAYGCLSLWLTWIAEGILRRRFLSLGAVVLLLNDHTKLCCQNGVDLDVSPSCWTQDELRVLGYGGFTTNLWA